MLEEHRYRSHQRITRLVVAVEEEGNEGNSQQHWQHQPPRPRPLHKLRRGAAYSDEDVEEEKAENRGVVALIEQTIGGGYSGGHRREDGQRNDVDEQNVQ